MSRSASEPRITVITCCRAACGAIRLSPLTKDGRLGDWRQAAPNARELLPSANRGLLHPQGELKSVPKAIERTRPARPQKGCRTPVAELVLRVPCLMPPVRLYHHEPLNTTYSACRTRDPYPGVLNRAAAEARGRAAQAATGPGTPAPPPRWVRGDVGGRPRGRCSLTSLVSVQRQERRAPFTRRTNSMMGMAFLITVSTRLTPK